MNGTEAQSIICRPIEEPPALKSPPPPPGFTPGKNAASHSFPPDQLYLSRARNDHEKSRRS